MPPIDLTGRRFGRLTVICYDGNKKWKCLCECGRETVANGTNLKSGHTKSCGCLQRERASEASRKHCEVGTHLYIVWADMKARCLNKSSTSYPLYGERGISLCDERKDYMAFRQWAFCNGYADNLSLDRIDVNGNYDPTNCRWVQPYEQYLNKRCTFYLTICGIKKPAKIWCKETGAKYKTVFYRKKYFGWSDEESLYGRKRNASKIQDDN